MDTLQYINTVTAGVVAVATIVLAILTGFYVRLTHKILRAQLDPYVVLYARLDELRSSIIEIVIHNIGRSIATDIRFEFSRPMFWHAFGITEEKAQQQPAEKMVDGPLVMGIPALGPNEMRRITWGQFGGIKRELGDEVITVTVRFRGPGNSELPPVISKLDIKSFIHVDVSERDPLIKLVREVKELQKSVASIERSLKDTLTKSREESE